MEELGMKQKPLDRLHCVVKRIQPKYIFRQEDALRLMTNVTIH